MSARDVVSLGWDVLDVGVAIVSGEGERGSVRRLHRPHTARGLTGMLTRERCGGDRWAHLHAIVVRGARAGEILWDETPAGAASILAARAVQS